MNIDWKEGLTPREVSEIERKLRYIDFLSSRYSEDVDTGDNVHRTAVAALVMGGMSYEGDAISAILRNDDANSDAHMMRRYERAVAQLLTVNADTSFDESRILSLHSSVWGDDSLSAQSGGVTASVARPHHSSGVMLQHELVQLVEWWLLQEVDDTVPPPVAVALFIYNYANSSTLYHGKEHMMYLLELLLMRRCGCHWVRLYSPCRTMCDDMLSYRKALQSGDVGQRSVSRWITYWMDHMYEAAFRANEMLSPLQPPPPTSPQSQLNTRQCRVLQYVSKHQPVKLADVVRYMHKESANTVKKDLYKLRDLGYVVSQGVLKGTLYYKG